MNNFTTISLNILQKFKLDKLLLKVSKNRLLSPLVFRYCWDSRNAQSYHDQYQRWRQKLDKQSITFAGKRILDIGSGGSFGLAYFFWPQNFCQWTSADYYHNLGNDRRVIKREQRLVANIEARLGRALAPAVVRGARGLVFGEQLRFITLEIASFNEALVEQYDVILSSAVLEHIPRPAMERALANLARYLKPGGIMIHEIDLRDHINVAGPFNFLRFSAEDWEDMAGGTIFYTNRLRVKDYLELFNRFNLNILFLETEQASLPPAACIHESFRGYTIAELAVTRLFVIAKKQESYV